MFDVIVIGAGVSGAFVTRNLSRYELNVICLEAKNDVGDVSSMANSAIVHSGYDPLPGTNKAKFNVLGNKMYPSICKELDVSFSPIGSMTLGFNEENMGFKKNENKVIQKLKENFSIPFINRIDNILIFDKLKEEDIKKLINDKLIEIKRKYLSNINLKIDDKVIENIIEESNYEECGARKIDKIIKDKIENQIIDNIISKKQEIYIKELIH